MHVCVFVTHTHTKGQSCEEEAVDVAHGCERKKEKGKLLLYHTDLALLDASQLCIEFYTAPASSSSTETPPAMYLGSELGRARAHATSCAICSDARSCSCPVLVMLRFAEPLLS